VDNDIPPEHALNVLGLTGLTAYFGLLHVGQPKGADETVLISGAAGATGMLVGRIAKLQGCRVVGIAGGSQKCAVLTGEMGFDAAVDYKNKANFESALKQACPKGVDVYFDNVGGEITDTVVQGVTNLHARVAMCGVISAYEKSDTADVGPRLNQYVLWKRLRMEGFIVSDYAAQFPEARSKLRAWWQQGDLRAKIYKLHGLESLPKALQSLFTGANIGKTMVQLF